MAPCCQGPMATFLKLIMPEEQTLRKDDPRVRVRKDLYESLYGIAEKSPRNSGVSISGMVDQAVEGWLATRKSSTTGPPPASNIPAANAPYTPSYKTTTRYHELLENLIVSGDAVLRKVVLNVLDASGPSDAALQANRPGGRGASRVPSGGVAAASGGKTGIGSKDSGTRKNAN